MDANGQFTPDEIVAMYSLVKRLAEADLSDEQAGSAYCVLCGKGPYEEHRNGYKPEEHELSEVDGIFHKIDCPHIVARRFVRSHEKSE